MIKRILADDPKYKFSNAYDPVAYLSPGDSCQIETLDNQAGRIQSESDFGTSDIEKVNPTTGPIIIEGAEPGDLLAVKIKKIDLAKQGHIMVIDGYGLLKDEADSPKTKIMKIVDNRLVFNQDLRLDLHSMVGVIAVAPKGEEILNLFGGGFGGNLDNKDVTDGSTVYLPVQVQGAHFFIGDVHAAMGDGELCLMGVEIAADVTVSFDLIKKPKRPLDFPMVETTDAWETTCYSLSLREAIEVAGRDLVYFVQEQLGLSLEEAIMLVSSVGDVMISQAAPHVAPGTGASVRVKIPKKYLPGSVQF